MRRALALALLLLLRLGLRSARALALGRPPGPGSQRRPPPGLGLGLQRLAGPGPRPALRPSWLRPPGVGPEGRRPRPGVCGAARWGYVPGARGRGRDEYERRYSRAFPPQLRAQMRDLARAMFVFGYDNYMAHAFPQDELNPIHCRGRGPDRGDP